MVQKDRGSWIARSAQSLQDNIIQAGPAASASYALIGAILLLGGVGYALDVWLGTGPWLVGAGLLTGLIVGFYELVKTAGRR